MAKPIGLLLITLAASAVLALHAPPAFDQAGGAAQCLNVGEWARPGHGGVRRLTAPALYDEAARQRVVLLGEQHDDAEHHRWQLQVLGALHARRPDMALGFEMFPRRVQPVLDRWVAGELSEADFLREADWDEVWGFDARLYLPLFHFARMNRIPMLALNVDNALVREVGRAGLDAVPPERREGVGRPAPLHPDYRAALLEAFRMHMRAGPHGGEDAGDSPAFRHFTDAQLLRDRAFAEGIAAVAARSDAPLVVGIIGAGHMRHGHGVPQQLAALGIDRVVVYLPHEAGGDCRALAKGYADAVFGVRAPPADASWRPLLGVRLSDAGDGVRVDSVVKDSPAEAAGLRAGDVIAQIAGEPVSASRDVVAAVQRQAPGTWLPLRARRDGAEVEIVAKFPIRARPTP
jgi:uncharacterized iron-regulated protein